MPNAITLGIFSRDNYRDLVIPLTANAVAQSLAGATVQVRLKNLMTGESITTGGTIDEPASAGVVRRAWSEAEVTATVPFEYRMRVVVTFANGKRQTFPQPGLPELRVKILPADT